MELIRISDQKMKIMLTPADMTQYDLHTETLGENDEQIHKAFRLLLDDIRRQTGFAVDDRKFSIQYFPSRGGGCEMFVCGCVPSPMESSGADEKKRSLPARVGRALTVRPKPAEKNFFRECAYRFDTMDDLLRVCRRLCLYGFAGESRAFRDEESRYYLLLETLSSSPFAIPDELAFLVEYGAMENSANLKRYLSEHGKVICESGAVSKLGILS